MANVACGSTTAVPVAGARGSYSPDNGHEGRSPSRLLRATSGQRPPKVRTAHSAIAPKVLSSICAVIQNPREPGATCLVKLRSTIIADHLW